MVLNVEFILSMYPTTHRYIIAVLMFLLTNRILVTVKVAVTMTEFIEPYNVFNSPRLLLACTKYLNACSYEALEQLAEVPKQA